jgi:hypothetical protein
MKTLSRNDLLSLVEITDHHLVSAYMPMLTGVDGRQNPIRIKNLLSMAEEALIKKGVKPLRARQMIAETSELLAPQMFGPQTGPGIAVFLSDGEPLVYRLPFACEEVCRVGRQFYIIPALRWLRSDAPYYVLAVSQNQVRFFRGTRDEIEQVSVPNMPADRDTAVRFDDADPGLQAHSARPYLGRIKEGMAFHGHGGAPDAAKDFIAEYFREIDRALSGILRQATEPLVFVGVDYLFPIYQEANTYAHLRPTPVTGNPELSSPDELRQRAWPLVEEMVRESREAELEKFGNCISHGRTNNRLDEILIAAEAGAVETLFIEPTVRRTGVFDPERRTVHVDDEPRDESEDLINLVATLVLRNGGAVESLESGRVPGGGETAAILRYPFSAVPETSSASVSK